MPKSDKTSVLLRQIELLKQLPSRGSGKTATELTKALIDAGYTITKRQVERDLNELLEAFAIDKNDTSIPHGWKWGAGVTADIPGMTITEALSLHLVERIIRPLMPVSMLEGLEARFRQADKQLAALGKENPKAKWTRKVRFVSPTMSFLPPIIDSAILSTVQEALLSDVLIEMDYQGINEESKLIRVSPLALVNRGVVSYLVATAFEYDDVRLYAMHRIRQATKTKDNVKRPPGFDLDAYIEAGGLQFGNGKSIRLSALASLNLAKILEETPLSADQKLSPSGEQFKLTATVTDSWQLTWWLMSQGPEIEVISPVALRRKIGAQLMAAADRYTNESAQSKFNLD
jgi:predicted DNA-binding transcriptional regulator YafY